MHISVSCRTIRIDGPHRMKPSDLKDLPTFLVLTLVLTGEKIRPFEIVIDPQTPASLLLLPLPTLSNQDRDLHKEAVLSAP